MQYIVHKFGGTSLANTERFVSLKSLLSGSDEIIVVSAMQGITSALQSLLDAAEAAKPHADLIKEIEERHLKVIHDLALPNSKEIIASIQKDIAEMKEILHAVSLIHSTSQEIQDLVLGYGELWSGKITAAYLGKENQVSFLDASTVLFIYDKNGILCIDWQKSQEAFNAFLKNHTFNQLVVTGYIASTQNGRRTTLGRNGSDFSAAIFAKLCKAKSLTIWTDVDGIYSADPNRVRSAFVIDSLSYAEALELAYFGAKVLHPMTMAPLFDSHIPLYIKNSLHASAKGTFISAQPQASKYLIKGLSCIDNVALINIEGAGFIGVSGIAARVFSIVHQAKISVILISQASSEYSICFAVAGVNGDAAVAALTEGLQFEIERKQIQSITINKSCAILSAVGENMVGEVGIASRLSDSLAQANINIRAIAQGSSERNISVVVNQSDINKALRVVHAGFYLSRKTISVGLIGPGRVGATLLSQIEAELEKLKAKYQVNLYVRGIMNSKKMLLSDEAIDLKNWETLFKSCDKEANLHAFTQHIISHDVPHGVIIDCTANADISQRYVDFIEQGLDVITPNKHANAGDLAYYKKLKNLTHKKNHHYLYETTVCAGLPVINTLQDIIKTGDEIIKIEGIVSGTLSFVFNELMQGRAFSEVVKEAKERGYTEPDPRQDLSGMDVARKLVCLAREIGFDTTLEDVKVTNLVPPPLQNGSIEEFFAGLPAYDEQLKADILKANAKNERIAYVGIIDREGRIKVAMESFPMDHPFARLKGTDNMLIFHTRRYSEQPLVIEGPGAGAEVTAAGIFADLLRLVSFIS